MKAQPWIARSAAVLILISQVLLLGVVLEPTGMSAIWFSFVGHPALGLGIVLALVSMALRARERGPD